MSDESEGCGCMTCRVAIAAEINELVELTVEQYLHILESGGLEPMV
jgi:ferredoxin